MDKEKLFAAVKKFSEKKIVVIGDICLDKYVYGKVERVNPENPAAPLLKIERKEFRLGCAANVALNIAHLQANAILGSVIGDDYYGNLFEELCRVNNLNFFHVREGETIVKERSIEAEFNQYLLRADDGESALREMSEAAAQHLQKELAKMNPDAIILSDYNKKVFRGDFAVKIIELAKQKKIPIVVDPKPANAPSFQNATLICPNLKEAREIIGSYSEDEKILVQKVWKKMQTPLVIVTYGKKGMVCFNGSELTHIPTKVREVVDVTGSGDTACAVMTLGLACGLDLEETAHLANYAAGIVVEKQGTSTVTPKELIDRINEDDNI